ncbi:hypothetical protein GYMLUDRAFT_595796 [Collybiopsis luxurians FD-317 M1]|uniref:Uncharacterized protein n=1 Tax=Collybiopsis luxurians FD-317 M1 TaxID=944289 RepID=A0A0D0BYD1_9AGAR|nr:hypothetical protein GYMLUDRAFT_595796 [Collybiopsis luxurians FD-317 M1]
MPRPSYYRIVKDGGWTNRPHFQYSHGLKMTPDDIEEGNLILDEYARHNYNSDGEYDPGHESRVDSSDEDEEEYAVSAPRQYDDEEEDQYPPEAQEYIGNLCYDDQNEGQDVQEYMSNLRLADDEYEDQIYNDPVDVYDGPVYFAEAPSPEPQAADEYDNEYNSHVDGWQEEGEVDHSGGDDNEVTYEYASDGANDDGYDDEDGGYDDDYGDDYGSDGGDYDDGYDSD